MNARWCCGLCLLVTGCVASVPIADAPRRSPAPYYAGERAAEFTDTDVLWGGVIVAVEQFDHHAEIEVVAYPLDSAQRPLFEAAEQGRFIALRAGQLDSSRFLRGRYLTVRGPITGDREVTLRGERMRIAEVDARELALWPPDYRFQRQGWSLGIGISGG